MDVSNEKLDRLIAAIERLTRAIENMPHSITVYPANYIETGGRGGYGGAPIGGGYGGGPIGGSSSNSAFHIGKSLNEGEI